MRTCRVCHRTEVEAIFLPLVRTKCWTCHETARLKRKQRIADRLLTNGTTRRVARRRPGESSKHLAWIRLHHCVVSSGCGHITHAHHVREHSGGGTGMKPDDRWAVPICPRHHAELHQRGAKSFEEKYKLDLSLTAERFAACSPHLGEPQL